LRSRRKGSGGNVFFKKIIFFLKKEPFPVVKEAEDLELGVLVFTWRSEAIYVGIVIFLFLSLPPSVVEAEK